MLAVPDTWGQGTWDLEVPDRDTGLDLVGLGRLQQDQGTADLELLALDTGQVLGMGQVLDTDRVSLAIKPSGGAYVGIAYAPFCLVRRETFADRSGWGCMAHLLRRPQRKNLIPYLCGSQTGEFRVIVRRRYLYDLRSHHVKAL